MTSIQKRGENPAKGYLSRYIKDLPFSRFSNEYGEVFNIHSNGTTVFVSGSEVDSMVDESKQIEGYVPLFNPNFNVWSNDELFKLGQSLIDVAVQNGHKPEEDETLEYNGYSIYARVHFEGQDMYTLKDDGTLKKHCGFGGVDDESIVWYEIYDEDQDVTPNFDITTLKEAHEFVDKLIAENA